MKHFKLIFTCHKLQIILKFEYCKSLPAAHKRGNSLKQPQVTFTSDNVKQNFALFEQKH